MRRHFAAAALLTMFGATPGMAEEYPWCVHEPGMASYICRYTSFEQCHATAMGIGDCMKNPAFTNSQVPNSQAPATSPPPVTGNGDRRKRTN
jgi:hypothetical protein